MLLQSNLARSARMQETSIDDGKKRRLTTLLEEPSLRACLTLRPETGTHNKKQKTQSSLASLGDGSSVACRAKECISSKATKKFMAKEQVSSASQSLDRDGVSRPSETNNGACDSREATVGSLHAANRLLLHPESRFSFSRTNGHQIFLPSVQDASLAALHPHHLLSWQLSTPLVAVPTDMSLVNSSYLAPTLSPHPDQTLSMAAESRRRLVATPRLQQAPRQPFFLADTLSYPSIFQRPPSMIHPSMLERFNPALLSWNNAQANQPLFDNRTSRLGAPTSLNLSNPLVGSMPSYITSDRSVGLPVRAGALFDPTTSSDLAVQAPSLESSLPGAQDMSISDSGNERLPFACLGPSVARDRASATFSASIIPLPQADEGPIPHFSQRPHVPLATDEDQNWLSEFLCFVRLELVEIFRANERDVRSRNCSKKVFHGQVGIRCRFCAHLPLSSRSNRSSSFPSSLSRIYQSLTMMLRDHFGKCEGITPDLKKKFLELKGKTSQGATDSKNYWVYSAQKRGLSDSQGYIWVNDCAPPVGSDALSFRTGTEAQVESSKPINDTEDLVRPEDKGLVSDFLYSLMTQVQRVSLEASERTGNRRNLDVGLAGIACRHCCVKDRKGLSRLFPVRRRSLPNKVNDLYEHIRRCTLCPPQIKEHLMILRERDSSSKDSLHEKQFYDRIWARMGPKRESKTK